MIPDFNPNDYDPDSEIPDELLAALLIAIPTFENARMNTLISGASKNYLKGTKIAYERLGEKFVSSEVKDDVYKFLKTYQAQINEGYTVIQGEKVYWLRDRTLNERQKIFDIVKNGIIEGTNPNVTKKEFQNYFKMQKSQAEAIARTETAYVQARGRDDRYKQSGVKRVKWLLGKNPCPRCQNYGGHIFTWDSLPGETPLHPRCTCDLAPVLDPNEKETQTKDDTQKSPNELEKIIRDYETSIKDRTTEKAFVFDKNGNVLINKAGNEDSVHFTKAELKLLKGNILTHNHPGESPFSREDIKLACEKNLKEIRVIDKNGTYMMNLKDGSNFTKGLWDTKISTTVDSHINALLPNYQRLIDQGKVDAWKANSAMMNRAWTRTSKDVENMEYSFIKGVE